MKWSKKALLCKIEGAYGVDPVPAVGSDEILLIASDVVLTPINASPVERDIVRAGGEYGSYSQYILGKHVMLEFSVEMAGGGAADAPAPYSPLLRACGLAESVSVGVKVEYDPVSESFESSAIYMALDGILHKMLGVRGDATWVWEINNRPRIRFRILGLFVAIADAAFPAMDYSGHTAPVPVTDVNTPTLTLHGTAIKVSALSVNLGNRVEYRELVNQTSIEITDRKSNGQITFEQVSVATKDWYGIVTAETLGALQIIHGTAAGNICQLDAPKAQLMNPRPGNSQDKVMLTVDLNLTPDAGDDEVKYTTK